MKKIILGIFFIGTSLMGFSQNLCNTVGIDSTSLSNNGYVVGDNDCGQGVNTKSKWVNTAGVDSIAVRTFQHRLYDYSKIYDGNNNLIWEWLGESVSATTWYDKYHGINVTGNDSIRLEFHNGFGGIFCNGQLEVVDMTCSDMCMVYDTVAVYDTVTTNITVYDTVTTEITVTDTNYVTKYNYVDLKDSLDLYNGEYYVGPWNKNCNSGVHTESKWVDTKGMDSIRFKTFQHRTYDKSVIYDEKGNLIYQWGGVSQSATWYTKYHNLPIIGNDSIKIEFYQGFDQLSNGTKFCNGYLQIIEATFDKSSCNQVYSDTVTVSIYDTITITDTNYVNVNNYIDVYDSLIIDLTGVITAVDAPFNSNLQVKVYPNPASENLTLEVLDASATETYLYQLFSVTGQNVVSNGFLDNEIKTIDLSSLNSGIYYVRFYDSQFTLLNIAPIVIRK